MEVAAWVGVSFGFGQVKKMRDRYEIANERSAPFGIATPLFCYTHLDAYPLHKQLL